MYGNPRKLRINVLKLRLSDEELQLVQEYVELTGEQRAVLAREIVVERARSELHARNKSTQLPGQMTAPCQAL